MFGGSSISSAFAQGGMASINSSGWVVGKGAAVGGSSGFPFGVLAIAVMALYILKNYKGVN